MKTLSGIIVWGIAISLFAGCSGNKTNVDEEQREVLEEISKIPNPKPAETTFSADQLASLQEQLFFFLREQVVGVDNNTFVKYEEIKVSGNSFEYSTVVIEKDMLAMNKYPGREQAALISLSSFDQNFSNEELGDSIRITGSFEANPVSGSQSELPLSQVKINITSHKYSSVLYSTPYSYSGFERSINESDFTKDLIVKFNEPVIYSKDEIYLAARVKKLRKQDLSGMSKDDLAYLRNEIFARHGHTFKTDKMKSYFEAKEWYHPYFTDATLFLNETEKENVQLIRSMES